MKLTAATVAAVALSAAATPTLGAEPIRVVGDAPATPAAQACVPAGRTGGDLECTLNLTPPRAGAEAGRVVIRAQWAAPCTPRSPQVVDMDGPAPAAKGLPVVDQAAPKAACAS